MEDWSITLLVNSIDVYLNFIVKILAHWESNEWCAKCLIVTPPGDEARLHKNLPTA